MGALFPGFNAKHKGLIGLKEILGVRSYVCFKLGKCVRFHASKSVKNDQGGHEASPGALTKSHKDRPIHQIIFHMGECALHYLICITYPVPQINKFNISLFFTFGVGKLKLMRHWIYMHRR